jgi:putative tryptophan/tyrosine transport system substrate-binding protein
MGKLMRRRDFISLLAGGVAATASPITLHAQQAAHMRRVGMLSSYAERDPQVRRWTDAFVSRLQQLGWTAGKNLQIDYRWSSGDLTVMQAYAKELIALQPDAIVASNTPPTAALLRETRTIPIVFVTATDPIGSGFVRTIARPRGNATGFFALDSAMGGKWLEILKQIAPSVTRVALIFDPDTAPYSHYFSDPFEAAAKAASVEPVLASVHDLSELNAAVASVAKGANGGLVAMPDTFTTRYRDQIIALAAANKLPAIYPFGFMAESGGLLSYGADETEGYRNAAIYVDRILRGQKPSDLPVQLPTKLEMIINLQTAKALGLTIPQTLLVTADEVIQ